MVAFFDLKISAKLDKFKNGDTSGIFLNNEKKFLFTP